MSRVVEAVPNFSEGRRVDVVEEIRAALASVDGVRLLDSHVDADHNRSVITLAGDPDRMLESLLAGARVASERIDLTRHRGQHPRIGATDVIPLVPLKNILMTDCADLARETGRAIADTLGIPVYLYEAAALNPARRRLERIRRIGFERLCQEVNRDRQLRPDFGPARLHPTAGATCVGARKVLIAFNINLATRDVALARRIASSVRESSGGLPGIKALGLFMEASQTAQVSLNLTDYARTGLATVLHAVEDLAHDAGVAIASSELVGLAPEAALEGADPADLRIAGFTQDKILESRLRAVGL